LRIRRRTILFIVWSPLFLSCASSPKYRSGVGSGDGSVLYSSEFVQRGIASYYGREDNGKPTASGEIYDMNGITAAHRTLPFGTMLEVTNLENGKKVLVRVNDRGPFVGGRIIDLSVGAARRLGMLDNGTALVEIRVKRWGSGGK
jgi:rare lipoprotein A